LCVSIGKKETAVFNHYFCWIHQLSVFHNEEGQGFNGRL